MCIYDSAQTGTEPGNECGGNTAMKDFFCFSSCSHGNYRTIPHPYRPLTSPAPLCILSSAAGEQPGALRKTDPNIVKKSVFFRKLYDFNAFSSKRKKVVNHHKPSL